MLRAGAMAWNAPDPMAQTGSFDSRRQPFFVAATAKPFIIADGAHDALPHLTRELVRKLIAAPKHRRLDV